MKQFPRVLAAAVLAGLLAGPSLAADEAQPKSEKKPAAAAEKKPNAEKAAERAKQAEQRRGNQGVDAFFRLPETIKLTDAQKEQVAALKKEYTGKIREVTRKQRNLLTDEQKQAQRETRQKLQDAGTKGKEAQQAVAAALKLSDEQKKQDAEIKAARGALQKEIQGKVVALLTAEQKALLPKRDRQAKKAPAADGAKPRQKKKVEAAGDN